MTITRFAPSPTGHLHVGNIRTALHNWLLARNAGGRFMLRIDDTDAARSREEYVEAIRADLDWLGLAPDGEERQSERLALYEAAFAALKDAGRIYPAYETAQELEVKRKIQLGRGKPPIYDRAALALTEAERAAKEGEGIAPHWRFRLDHDEPIAWEDGIRGPQKFDAAQLSDPVIRRADGSWLYMLPSAVDDLDMGITDVLRGEDHVSNTAVQIQMFTALIAAQHESAQMPRFAHEALLVGKEGKLSKRLGSLGCDAFRERDIEPAAIIALLARLGTSQPVEPIADRSALLEAFDVTTFSRARPSSMTWTLRASTPPSFTRWITPMPPHAFRTAWTKQAGTRFARTWKRWRARMIYGASSPAPSNSRNSRRKIVRFWPRPPKPPPHWTGRTIRGPR